MPNKALEYGSLDANMFVSTYFLFKSTNPGSGL
ncbi:hypothetical protein [Coxiella-like endosymbiont]